MRYTTIIGILLIAIGLVSSFIGKINFSDLVTEPDFALGLLYGGGIGILIGGIVGWMYKKPYSNLQNKQHIVEKKDSTIN